ncbi:MAG: hypothetical protein F6K39_29255 [Okeania sp. SIO3B3]|nr:hypothetical protein [Okeania sp. SIO3B3]
MISYPESATPKFGIAEGRDEYKWDGYPTCPKTSGTGNGQRGYAMPKFCYYT